MITIENESNFDAAIKGGLNLFLGSGFSILAKDRSGKPLPTGSQLIGELASEFSLPSATNLDLSQVCTVIEHTRSDQLRNYLTQRFLVGQYDERYKQLEKVSIRNIFTTNIDDLLYQVFADSKSSYLHDIDALGASYEDKSAISMISLHGSVLNERRPYRFGAPAIAAAFATDSDRWHFLSNRIRQFPTLFWGYSVGDAGTLQALNPDMGSGQLRDMWILVHEMSGHDGTVDFFRAMNFQIIAGDTASLLDYFGKIKEVDQPTGDPDAVDLEALFPQESIPRIGQFPVRSVVEFYLGASPQWSDIILGDLHKTNHFRQARNAINSGKHTMLIGAPVSGKSTLILQLATEEFAGKAKFISNYLTLEKAQLILRNLGHRKAVVFLDNLADSLDAVQFLSTCDNITLCCAERDYNYGIVDHKVRNDRIYTIDVTELSAADIQACVQAIPREIRRANYVRPVSMGRPGIGPSLFELIEANVTKPTLNRRFARVLHQLNSQDPLLRDVLVMVSYVHQARTPVSMDMLFAFLRGITKDPDKVLEIRLKLGHLLSDYREPDLVEEQGDQDYYITRSSAVSEAVLANTQPSVLKAMLLRFHANVSPYRIPRFDVFRRYGFDQRLVSKAFPDAEEGKAFYEQLYARDHSPYLLQHSALYLAKKHRYQEAFRLIDQAILESGGRIWSIRNSHAIILFEANTDHYEHPSGRQALQESMELLTDCYHWDNRKPFHAVTFADQALRYWNFYGDTEALNYLRTAHEWLGDESVRSSWNHSVKRLLKLVDQRLEDIGHPQHKPRPERSLGLSDDKET